ncbi:hypothetical protein NW765_000096 [Fusarium oxysporum]|nr:hypothetical protein NW765_000096 [Fusarium oxysporum]KAJ4267845.1 hypothetical protein NW764_014837 [Fusarium oxysporum]
MGQHILILGGHGKIAQILTRQLLKKPRTIATVIRAQEQVPQIESLASGQKRLNVLVRSLEDIKSVCQAKNILEEVKPDAVVWSAGAGGKGGLDRLAADEVLLQNSSLQSDFSGISLRPGMLSDEPAGQVELGKTKTSRGNVSRASVADTIVSLLENQNVESSWLDLLYGDHDVNVSVERIASAGLDAAEGEGN